MHMSNFFLITYIITIITFIIQRTHLLITLLCLEGIILSIVLILPSCLYFSGIIRISTLALIILTIGACEARLGLRIIVVISRSHGSDLINNLTSRKC